MNKLCIFPILLIFMSFSCQGQNQLCNQSVKYKSLSKKVPPTICLPSNQVEFEEITITDFNQDGIKDFIGKWQPKNLADGDTLHVSVYIQIDSGSYEFLKIYSNLYPIYFTDYSLEYRVQDSLLNELKARYPGYPTKEVEFNGDKLLLHFEAGVGSYYFLHYRYDPEAKDWYLERRIYSEEDYEGNLHEVSNEYLWDERMSLEEFNYFDYL